jgi:tetratricopeptide (TPR) repeat protein
MVLAILALTLSAQGAAVPLDLSLDARLENAIVSYGRYVELMFWPTGLAGYYPHPGQWPVTTILLSLAMILLTTLVACRFIKTAPYLFVGWMFFLGTLLPVIGIIQVGAQAMADRYLYIPSIGIIIAASWLYAQATRPLNLIIRSLPIIALLVLLSVQTVQYLPSWRNSVSFWTNVLVVNDPRYVEFVTSDTESMFLDEGTYKGLFLPYANLSLAMAHRGYIDEARMHFDIAVSINPSDPGLRKKYAQTMFQHGRLSLAKSQLEAALILAPEDKEILSLLAAIKSLSTQ